MLNLDVRLQDQAPPHQTLVSVSHAAQKFQRVMITVHNGLQEQASPFRWWNTAIGGSYTSYRSSGRSTILHKDSARTLIASANCQGKRFCKLRCSQHRGRNQQCLDVFESFSALLRPLIRYFWPRQICKWCHYRGKVFIKPMVIAHHA